MSYLAITASFQYLCYGSTASAGIVLRRQILTSNDDPRAERVNQ